jgi:aminopeptidase N
MTRRFLQILVLFLSFQIFAQKEPESLKTYRGEETKIHDLVHTKLKVSFDFSKRQMHGEAWIKAKPHFYVTQKFTLDAKSMVIHEVKMGDKKLDFNYESDELIISLGNAFAKDEEFEVYIKYTAKPEEVTQKGSAAITDAKGLYFIDPDGTDPDKPTQIWTQGETESSSCWFPTIDSPNQKSTQEIYITVPKIYTTLSNGLLNNQTDNADGTRTDYWKMSQPHAPYLFFMGIGEYSVVKDTWNGKQVDYYVEKEYEDEAKDIFGLTPEMIQFYSDRFGVIYPWEKYSQIVGRDYVSGAMENTTTTLHSESAYQKKGQLIDENTWEDVISHELSHHWFGDLVTTESWSNLTVNESFATYAEYLWREFKYGKDHADAHLFEDKDTYFMGGNESKNLVRFHYAEREDMFDGVSYQKGGVILHMLRKELGDEAFFAGLKKYLHDNQFQAAEAHHLRLALEEVSGKDLNPFFNQWYYANAHPKLNVTYEYNDVDQVVTIKLKQSDKVFQFPLRIDIYESGKRVEHQVEVTKKDQSFSFKYNQKPNLININADHILLCEINDIQKTTENYIFQLLNAPHFEDRREAILVLSNNQNNDESFKALMKALTDNYHEIRILALQNIDLSKKFRKDAIKIIEGLATSDPKTKVQGEALGVLGKLLDIKYKPLFERGMKSESYAMKSNSIISLYEVDKPAALEGLKAFDEETKQDLAPLLVQIYIKENDESQMPFIAKNFLELAFSNREQDQDTFMKAYNWIGSSDNKEAISNLVSDFVSKGKRYKKYGVDSLVLGLLQQVVQMQTTSKNSQKNDLIQIVKKGIAELVD